MPFSLFTFTVRPAGTTLERGIVIDEPNRKLTAQYLDWTIGSQPYSRHQVHFDGVKFADVPPGEPKQLICLECEAARSTDSTGDSFSSSRDQYGLIVRVRFRQSNSEGLWKQGCAHSQFSNAICIASGRRYSGHYPPDATTCNADELWFMRPNSLLTVTSDPHENRVPRCIHGILWLRPGNDAPVDLLRVLTKSTDLQNALRTQTHNHHLELSRLRAPKGIGGDPC